MKTLLQVAMHEAGTEEVEGSLSNERILQYADEAGFDFYQTDETPWCSVFLSWVALKAGFERSTKANARSWLNVGKEIGNPEPGDIVIFWRDSINSWKGHVALFVGYSQDLSQIYCLGGNQSDQVSISTYSVDRLLGFRRLRPNEQILLGETDLKIGMRGQAIRRLQTSLAIAGFSPGAVDGIFGPLTEKALKIFQSSHDELDITGIADLQTRKLLEATTDNSS